VFPIVFVVKSVSVDTQGFISFVT